MVEQRVKPVKDDGYHLPNSYEDEDGRFSRISTLSLTLTLILILTLILTLTLTLILTLTPNLTY
jgi:hypothetical protein